MWGWCMDWVGRVLDCFILLKMLKYPLVSLLWGNGWWFSCEDVIAHEQVDRTYITYPNCDRDSTIILWSGKSLFQIGGTNSKGHIPIERKPLREYLQALSENLPSQRRSSHSSRDPNRTIQWCNPSTSLNYQVKWGFSFPSRTCQTAPSPHRHPATKQVRVAGHLTRCCVDGCCWFCNVLQMYCSDAEESTSLIAMPWDGLTGYNC